MIILNLDLGTKMGFAISQKNKIIKSGSVNFQPTRFQSSDYRFILFKKFLSKHDMLGIDRVFFEEVRKHIGVDAAHCYGGFKAVLTTYCQEKNIPYSGVPVGTIKKSICGNGGAKKDKVIEAVQNLGYNPVDDNEADAIALALHSIKNN